MKLLTLVAGVAAAFAMSACDSHQKNVQDAQKDLNQSRAEASKDVNDAQNKAIADVNDQKEDSAKDIQKQQKDLADEQRDAAKDTQSSTTTAVTDTKNGKLEVSKEECAKLAASKTVRPEDKAKYDACSKLKH